MILCRRFHEKAADLNVSASDLYNALLADAEIQPPDWNLQGRQANVWKELGTHDCLPYYYRLLNWDAGYIPDDMLDAGGANTKQVSRTLEVHPQSYPRMSYISIDGLARFR